MEWNIWISIACLLIWIAIHLIHFGLMEGDKNE